ncbi:MAG: hypothetical protein ACP5IA_02750 [Sediminispirochaetaceae bacterium]
MDLERSDGKITQNPGKAELEQVIDGIGREYDFCILGEGDSFVQTTGSDGGLLVQYRDEEGMFESVRSDLDSAAVKDIFIQFLNGQSGWKTSMEFSQMEMGGAGADSGAAADSGGGIKTGAADGSGEGRTEKSFADQLKDSVKKEAMNSVNRAARKITRGVFRKFF